MRLARSCLCEKFEGISANTITKPMFLRGAYTFEYIFSTMAAVRAEPAGKEFSAGFSLQFWTLVKVFVSIGKNRLEKLARSTKLRFSGII